MLRIDLKVGESVMVGGKAVLTLEEKSGQTARLAFEADRSVEIKRLPKPSVASVAAKNGLSGVV